MKKQAKTYAIDGMMEYQTIVRIGKSITKVNFTGGSINNGCRRPARFMTKNLVIQNAIEASNEYKRGRIRLERTITLNEEIPIEGPRTIRYEAEIGEPSPEDGPADAALSPDDKPADAEPSPGDKPADAILSPADKPADEEGEAEGLTEVEATCKDVAKQYLQDHFGERPAPLRTWADVQACAAKHGITFKSPTLE